MKKNLMFAALFAAALLPGAALADEVKFPTGNPLASVTVPDGWTVTNLDSGGVETYPDDGNDLYIAIDITDGDAATEDAVKGDFKVFGDMGLSDVSAEPKESKTTVNGSPAVEYDWTAKKDGKDAVINFVVIGATAKRALILGYAATTDAQDKYSNDLTTLASSLHVINE